MTSTTIKTADMKFRYIAGTLAHGEPTSMEPGHFCEIKKQQSLGINPISPGLPRKVFV
jgi:hypothetical protein